MNYYKNNIFVLCRNCGRKIPLKEISCQSIRFEKCYCEHVETSGLRNISEYFESIIGHLKRNRMNGIFFIKDGEIKFKVEEL